MTISQLIQLLESKIRFLNQQKLNAEQIGDVQRIVAIEAEMTETEQSLEALRNL